MTSIPIIGGHHSVHADPVDPLWVLWEAFGGPAPQGDTGPTQTGRCARCNATTDTGFLVRRVVSDKFTEWDHYTRDYDPIWCTPCTWGHTSTDLRTRAWFISGENVREADPADVAETLREPLGRHIAITIPLSRKKHTLPYAQWGKVTTDDRLLPWGHTEAARLRDVTKLRELGFTEAALTETVPRFDTLASLHDSTKNSVMETWARLTPWRRDKVYLDVSARITRTPRSVAA